MQATQKLRYYEEIFKDLMLSDIAAISAQSRRTEQFYSVVTFALDTAQSQQTPFKISFPFRSLFVLTATDAITNVNIKLQGIDQQYDRINLKQNYSFKFPIPVPEAYLDWSAQASKSITILFFLRGEFDTHTTSQNNSGGTTPYLGTAITTNTGVQVTNVAAQIFASDATRKMMAIQNGSGLDIWIGDSTVTSSSGTKPGIKIPPGGYYEWISVAACFAITAAGSTGANDISLTYFT